MSENKLVDASIIFIGLVFLFVILNQFQAFLRPFAIAIILTFLFVPLTRMQAQKKKLMWASVVGIIASLFIFVIILSALFVDDSQTTQPAEEVESSIDDLLNIEPISIGSSQFDITKLVESQDLSQKIAQLFSKLVGSIGSFFSEAFLIILFLIFLLPSHDKTIEKISKKLDSRQKKNFITALTQIEESIRTYLSIKSVISLLTALCSVIVMFLFGVKFLVLFGVLIFFLNFIPSIGSIAAVFIVLSVHFLTAPFTASFFVLAALLILIQLIFGNIIEPKFAGKELELSPVIILLSLFFWGSVWGIGGMFFAVPLTAIIKVVLQNLKSTKHIVPYLG